MGSLLVGGLFVAVALVAAVAAGGLVAGPWGAAVGGTLLVAGVPVFGFTWARSVRLLQDAAGVEVPTPLPSPVVPVPSPGATAGSPAVTAFARGPSTGELRALLDLAHEAVLPAGTVLCREGDPADHVFVLLSGLVRVSVRAGRRQRPVALHGPGEIIGERASPRVRRRPATVTAVQNCHVLVAPTARFLDFLDAHPRTPGEVERMLYRRLTEERAGPPGWPEAAWRRAWPEGHCSILFTDIAGFGSRARDDRDRRAVRTRMYELLEEAFAAPLPGLDALYVEDRGDGALVVAPPWTPTRLLVDPVRDRLAAGLRRYNREAGPGDARWLQLRAALHVGPVERDPRGVSGSAIIQAARLLEAPALKARMRETGADLGFIVSEFVYEHVVRHGGERSGPAGYARTRVRVKEAALAGWVRLSEPPATRLRAG
ncbi:cyclic nucleotide-binding domain-containing protein [Actinomadura kijaniata]|uniref:cyclic nucleotide-binding domain-containing protein n=1 Tax=Actinomadura kijaniata TaxID=46161 RepID=UPI003F1B41B0